MFSPNQPPNNPVENPVTSGGNMNLYNPTHSGQAATFSGPPSHFRGRTMAEISSDNSETLSRGHPGTPRRKARQRKQEKDPDSPLAPDPSYVLRDQCERQTGRLGRGRQHRDSPMAVPMGMGGSNLGYAGSGYPAEHVMHRLHQPYHHEGSPYTAHGTQYPQPYLHVHSYGKHWNPAEPLPHHHHQGPGNINPHHEPHAQLEGEIREIYRRIGLDYDEIHQMLERTREPLHFDSVYHQPQPQAHSRHQSQHQHGHGYEPEYGCADALPGGSADADRLIREPTDVHDQRLFQSRFPSHEHEHSDSHSNYASRERQMQSRHPTEPQLRSQPQQPHIQPTRYDPRPQREFHTSRGTDMGRGTDPDLNWDYNHGYGDPHGYGIPPLQGRERQGRHSQERYPGRQGVRHDQRRHQAGSTTQDSGKGAASTVGVYTVMDTEIEGPHPVTASPNVPQRSAEYFGLDDPSADGDGVSSYDVMGADIEATGNTQTLSREHEYGPQIQRQPEQESEGQHLQQQAPNSGSRSNNPPSGPLRRAPRQKSPNHSAKNSRHFRFGGQELKSGSSPLHYGSSLLRNVQYPPGRQSSSHPQSQSQERDISPLLSRPELYINAPGEGNGGNTRAVVVKDETEGEEDDEDPEQPPRKKRGPLALKVRR
ncbi:hypothetical protein MKZ38_006806 [Zalerion maritima]|uniref:Uncharacterized protein n=1 Tax=Zalerion maritima TaxID=339359 RepID=A0AAD5RV82_9PEZI|nr:hypothetical protein MKZ38_006806 [Zalerion maritima]